MHELEQTLSKEEGHARPPTYMLHRNIEVLQLGQGPSEKVGSVGNVQVEADGVAVLHPSRKLQFRGTSCY
jgi:hypothetical protein